MIMASCLFSSTLLAAPTPAPAPQLPIPAAPTLGAKAYVLQDNGSGQIIVSVNGQERLPPASLTKMMTVYVVDHEIAAGRLKLDDPILISEKAWRSEGSRMFVDVNSTVPARDLLNGVIIQSGNDASIAFAEHIAGTEEAFADQMNAYAKALGMKNTHFMNATGMPDPNHYTTAEDMAILARAIVNEFPDTYKVYSQKEFLYNGIKQSNRNSLLWRDPTVDGIKTGHTDDAGFCLVASALRNNMRFNAVILGAANEGARAEQAQSLLNYGFRFYKTQALLTGNKPIAQTTVYQGKTSKLPIGVEQDLMVTIPQNQSQSIGTSLAMHHDLRAPITRGQVVGELTITMNDQVLVKTPVVALENVERAGIVGRFFGWIKLFFKGLLSKGSSAPLAEGIALTP
ncbi:MAG: D-alanyl-D-alanine carboxypeptidase family protein [Gammaproteobacteria bacterium]